MSKDEAGLLRQAPGQPFYTEERCFITELLNDPQCSEVSLARCRVEPGVTTQLHRLSVAERYVVESGQGMMELDGQPAVAIGAGDSVLIPPGCAQRVKNDAAEDLVFLCICTPRFEPLHYENIETEATPSL